jgi:hypothetical protein
MYQASAGWLEARQRSEHRRHLCNQEQSLKMAPFPLDSNRDFLILVSMRHFQTRLSPCAYSA